MSFGAPLALTALAALPLLAAWYARRERGRAAAQAAFASAPLLESVAPERPRWRRHVPLIALLAALAALILALADPRTTQAQPVEHSAIMLANDVSGSMAATDVAPTRLRAAQHAARAFLRQVPAHVSVGVMTFDQTPDVLTSPTRDRAAVERALTGWRPHGGTAIGVAIRVALNLLTRIVGGRHGTHPPAAIVLLSDGGSTSGVSPLTEARAAARAHIRIYTVALGTAHGTISVIRNGRSVRVPAPPDPTLLRSIARASKGRAFTERDAGHLDAVYRHLGATLTHRRAQKRLEAGFAGAGLVLLALGTALSLRWFGRLI
jgi:Ca-activated chloride channel homolog